MPQPLSRVKPDASVTLNTMIADPMLGLLVSNIVGESAQIDHELGLLLVHILGANARPALAMFDTFDSQRAQMRMIRAAAKAALGQSTEKHRVFEVVCVAAETAQKERHKLAHWLWGSCPELPETLLVANPEFVRAQTIEQLMAALRAPITLANLLSGGSEQKQEVDTGKLFEVNKDQIFVYTKADLLRALRDLGEVSRMLFYFRYFMNPMPPNALSSGGDPHLRALALDLETSAGALQRLNSLRLFREVFLRGNGSTDPNSNP